MRETKKLESQTQIWNFRETLEAIAVFTLEHQLPPGLMSEMIRQWYWKPFYFLVAGKAWISDAV